MTKNTIVTFKWEANINTPLPSRNPGKISGIQYNANYINNHYNNIGNVLRSDFRYICVTDNSKGISEEIDIVPLWDYLAEYGGCLRRLYCYNKDAKELFGEKFLTCDLDLIWVNDFSYIFDIDADFVLLSSREMQRPDKIYRAHPGNGIISPGKYQELWDDIQEDTLNKLMTSRKEYTGTDQSWFNYHYTTNKPTLNIKFLKVGKDGFYEANTLKSKKLPNNSVCILFTGPRDPYQKEMQNKFPWIREYL